VISALALATLVCIGDSNTAGGPWLSSGTPTYAQILECDCNVSAHSGFGVIRDPSFGGAGIEVVKAAITEALFKKPDVIVLSFLTNDVQSLYRIDQILEVLGQRYRQARGRGARVLVVPPLGRYVGSGPVVRQWRWKRDEIRRRLIEQVDVIDIVDVSEISDDDYAEPLHLNGLGQAKLAAAVVGMLE